MPPKRKKRGRFLVRPAVFLAVVAGAGLWLRDARIAVPESWLERIAEHCSSDDFAVEVSGVIIDVRARSAHVARAEVYLRGIVSGPLISTRNTTVNIAPEFAKPEIGWIQSIQIGRIVISGEIANSGSPLYHLPDRGGVETLPRFDAIPVSADEAEICGIAGISGSAVISSDGGVLRASELGGTFGGGRESAGGWAEYDHVNDRVRVNVRGDVTPKTMLPLFVALGTRGFNRILVGFDFPEAPPKVSFALDCATVGEDGEMKITVGSVVPCVYRGVPVSSFSGVVSSGGTNVWSVVEITDLGLRRPEGSAFGVMTADLRENVIKFDGESKFDPVQFAKMAHLIEGGFENLPVSFPVSPRIRASGVYDISRDGDGAKNTVAGTFDVERIDIEKIINDETANSAKLENVAMGFSLAGNDLTVDSFVCDVFGGKLAVSGKLAVGETNRVFSASVKCEEMRLEQIAAFVGKGTPGTKGRLDCNVDFGGALSTNLTATFPSLAGSGELRLRETPIYQVPLFMGLTGFLARYVPGVDFLVAQDELKAVFELDSEGVKITQMDIYGAIFNASATGRIYYDGRINIRLKGHLISNRTWAGQALRWVLYPVSSTLSFRAEGTLDEPKWTMVNF